MGSAAGPGQKGQLEGPSARAALLSLVVHSSIAVVGQRGRLGRWSASRAWIKRSSISSRP